MAWTRIAGGGLLAAGLALGQAVQWTPPPSPAEVPIATVNGLRMAYWTPNAPGCQQWLHQGMVYKRMTANHIEYTVTLDAFATGFAAAVRVRNLSGHRLDLDLRGSWVDEYQPKVQHLRSVPAAEVARSLGRHAKGREMFLAMMGGLAERNGEAERENYIAEERIRQEAADLKSAVLAGALLPETLGPGQSLSGMIYFQSPGKRLAQALLLLLQDDVAYGIPFLYNEAPRPPTDHPKR